MFKVFIIPGLCAVTAFAQNSVKINDEQSGQMSITAVMANRAATIPGAP